MSINTILKRSLISSSSATTPRFTTTRLPALLPLIRQQSSLSTTRLTRTSSPTDFLHPTRRTSKMSFSNTDTGSKTADPYVAKNSEEPSLKEKVDDFKTLVSKTKFCLLTTKSAQGLLVSRAMAVAAKEGQGVDLIFHTNTESGKTDDLQNSSDVNVGFIDSSGQWASISGEATVETDRSRVREHYSPELKAWVGDLGDGKHDGGPEDPRIGLISVKAKTITYAVSSKNFVTSAIEVAKGAITGQTAQVNKLRHLEEAELQQCKSD